MKKRKNKNKETIRSLTNDCELKNDLIQSLSENVKNLKILVKDLYDSVKVQDVELKKRDAIILDLSKEINKENKSVPAIVNKKIEELQHVTSINKE